MSELTWEKTPETAKAAQSLFGSRAKYLVIGVVLLGVVAYLVISGTATARYYITVDELVNESGNVGKNVRVAGAVDGNTIHFDPDTQTLTFTVANIPSDNETIREAGGLAAVLHYAVENPNATRMQVVWENAEVPDLLQHEAQAIMSGTLLEDGTFQANEVLLKCPTRYSDEVPEQTVNVSQQ
jgi:cytochrome c-type biogenesis protein CcmE